jgi:hypothetical protein
MVDRFAFFGDVIEPYRVAAEDVNGVELPAGGAWLEASEREPDLEVYGPDGFHPTPNGAARESRPRSRWCCSRRQKRCSPRL